jgi:hypothetical protein
MLARQKMYNLPRQKIKDDHDLPSYLYLRPQSAAGREARAPCLRRGAGRCRRCWSSQRTSPQMSPA